MIKYKILIKGKAGEYLHAYSGIASKTGHAEIALPNYEGININGGSLYLEWEEVEDGNDSNN